MASFIPTRFPQDGTETAKPYQTSVTFGSFTRTVLLLKQALQRWQLHRRLERRLPDVSHARRILVLCTANRVRSPFAAHWLQRVVPEGVKVISRGVLDGGARCPSEAVDAAAEYGLDLSYHMARPVEPKELLRADLVLTMEVRMAHELAVLYPAIERAIVPLGYFDTTGRMDDIADPYQLSSADYAKAYAIIARCCGGLVHNMTASPALAAAR